MALNKKIIAGLLMICILTAFFFTTRYNTHKVAFVNTSMVFNGFEMKKILENEYKKVENMRKLQLDSIVLIMKMIAKRDDLKNKQELLSYKQEEYVARQQEFEESNAALTEKYNEQIWTQLNQYLKDYGNANGYDFIYGASGDGGLMYAADKNDITKDVISFINKKYEGLSNE